MIRDEISKSTEVNCLEAPSRTTKESLLDLLRKYIPADHSRQVTARYYIDELCCPDSQIRSVLDVGCGAGNSVDYFRRRNGDIRWIGLDIAHSPEVRQRNRRDAEFHSFDGANIPFESNSLDLVYSRQVFEHVRYPVQLLKEIRRVLRPGSHFIGSTSQLEPYHSFSYWNYTPFGFSQLLEEVGFELIEIRPGIDGLSLMARRALGCPKFLDILFTTESPLNLLIEGVRRCTGRSCAWSNAAKLLFCGHFCFLARKSS